MPCPHFMDALTDVGKCHQKQSSGLNVCPQHSPKMPLIHSQVALQSSLIMLGCLTMLPETGGSHPGQGPGARSCTLLSHRSTTAPKYAPCFSVSSRPMLLERFAQPIWVCCQLSWLAGVCNLSRVFFKQTS